jgi:hypothetical protein
MYKHREMLKGKDIHYANLEKKEEGKRKGKAPEFLERAKY